MAIPLSSMIPLPNQETQHFHISPSVEGDREGLYDVARHPELWDQHNCSDRYQRPVFDQLFTTGLAGKGALTFRNRKSKAIIGSSRYCMISAQEIEIGWTFIDRALWGTSANAEIKQALMAHAYQFVENIYWIVHPSNNRSRKAVVKLGAKMIDETHPRHKSDRVTFVLSKLDFER